MPIIESVLMHKRRALAGICFEFKCALQRVHNIEKELLQLVVVDGFIISSSSR